MKRSTLFSFFVTACIFWGLVFLSVHIARSVAAIATAPTLDTPRDGDPTAHPHLRSYPREAITPTPRRLAATTAPINITLDASHRFQAVDGFGCMPSPGWDSILINPPFQQTMLADLGESMIRISIDKDTCDPTQGDFQTPIVFVDDINANIAKFNFKDNIRSSAGNFGPFCAGAAKYQLDSVKIIASCWTPPAWMKGPDASGKPPLISGGSTCGGALIDTPANDQQFTRWLCAWIKGFQQAHGVHIYAISLQNEPAFLEGYDSCLYTGQQYVDALKAVKAAFVYYGLDTKIEGPEAVPDGSINNQMAYIVPINADPVAKAALDIYSLHTNQTSWWPAWVQATGVDGKPTWQTETSVGPNLPPTALVLANTIQQALVNGNVNGWLYYLGMDPLADPKIPPKIPPDQPYGDSLTTLINPPFTGAINLAAPQYCAFKQFSKMIRPGAVRISALPSDPNGLFVSAFVHPVQNSQTIVAINNTLVDQAVTFSGVTATGFTNNIITSATGADPAIPLLKVANATFAPVAVTNGIAMLTIPAQSIVTLSGPTGATPPPPPPPPPTTDPITQIQFIRKSGAIQTVPLP